ncbi:MAG: hypothetical protein J5787_05645 [Alphaproteobacteria bacterium]|nr:hypothetical protein [Alphaproteobacteria bacterium]
MILQEMIVTDGEGKTSKIVQKNNKDVEESLAGECIQSEDMYTFFAVKKKNAAADVVSAEKMPVRVRLTLPVGGDLNGMYRFPRVGEKVLVAVEGAAHYLMSYLPTKENPFSPKEIVGDKETDKEKTDVFDKEAQVLRYKKTGQNTSDSTYSEIGFYSETTEWKEKEEGTNKKLEDKSDLPIVDKIKVLSTGDIETRAQNYNETAAKRIGLFAGYGDDLEKRKTQQKQNLKDKKTALDLNAFPSLPQDRSDQDPSFFSGDIQMRAKKRIVLKAEDTIEIMAGNSMIRMDSTGISLISRRTSASTVNSWDTSLTLSSRDGVTMFGTKVNINSAYKFMLTDAWGGNITSFGGVVRVTGADIRLRSLCKASYVVKGVAASTSFATNVVSGAYGIAQEQGDGTGSFLGNKLPSYVSMAPGILGAIVSVHWGFDTMEKFAKDKAGTLVGIMDLIITLLGVVGMALDGVVLSQTDKKKGGRAGLTYALMVVEYGLILTNFVLLNTANENWMHASSILMSYDGNLYQTGKTFKAMTLDKFEANSALAGVDETFFGGLWKGFKGQDWWWIALEVFAAVAILGGSGVGGVFGFKHSSSVNADIRKELEAL